MIEHVNLSERVLNELLPAKAGVDCHEKHHIHIVDQLLKGIDRRARIECNARLAARRLDLLNDTVRVTCRLNMERNDVRSRLCERLDMRLGMLDHEVHVKDRLGHLAQALHDAGS